MAAVLACGGGTVLSHRSAAALWGIRRPGSHAIEVTARSKTRSRGNLRRHSSALPADEMTSHDGIPVTTVPRTLFDLAAISSTDVVEFALKESEYLRHYDALSLQDLVDRYPGRRGVAKARACLDRHHERPVGRVRSPLEERFVPFLRRHRLPPPQLNAWIDLGDKRFQVDCLWPRPRQIVELDGWEGHGTRTAFREDRARDRRLRVAGYVVTRLTWSQLDDEPTPIASDLRRLLIDPQTESPLNHP
jgi:very-short-patch-repair endonuclease